MLDSLTIIPSFPCILPPSNPLRQENEKENERERRIGGRMILGLGLREWKPKNKSKRKYDIGIQEKGNLMLLMKLKVI